MRYLLTGRVQWEHGSNGTLRVRVSPELVEVRDGAASETKWQQSYDDHVADVFGVGGDCLAGGRQAGGRPELAAQTQLAGLSDAELAAYDADLRPRARGDDPPTNRVRWARHSRRCARLRVCRAWAHVSVLRAALH